MKKFLTILVLIVLLFYHIYPQAISFFGYSYLTGAGALGLLLYLYNGRPYTEMVNVIAAYLVFGFFYLVTYYVTYYSDDYFYMNTKSQVGWLFSAYLVVFVFFQIYPKGTFADLLLYIGIAIAIQGVIAIAMNRNPAINNFFSSLQVTDAIAEDKRSLSGNSRLLGYGTAFFGAGIIYGVGLIVTMYVLIRKKMKPLNLILVSALYGFIFFAGLLSARTTMVGFVTSLILLFLSIFVQDRYVNRYMKKQYIRFISTFVILAIIGYTLTYIYFPQFADWAFEAFINYSRTGELRTNSSDSLEHMARFPEDLRTMLFGRGGMSFWGSDVGLSRLVYYVGYPGTIAFFFFPLALAWISMTKDKVANIMMLLLTPYAIALNVKGLADVNGFMYIFIFYFLHYKYYIFTPKLYRLGKFSPNKLRSTL